MNQRNTKRILSNLWAEFRFGVVGGLLSSPPERGRLQAALEELAECSWKHPVTGEPTKYGATTIERWYYRCRRERGSVIFALRRKVRSDAGRTRSLCETGKKLLSEQHREHPSWSYKLHADNLYAQLEKLGIGRLPSSAAVRLWMQSCGLFKAARCRGKDRDGVLSARAHVAAREVRSFENEYVGGLWHLDFHHCSRQVLVRDGKWHTPVCVAILDDHSRIACHVQWYLNENTESLVHAFSQGLQKRGLPRALLTDNGSAMVSSEFTEGLLRLGIIGETTLPYSPWQNGKQEKFFAVLEGRLLAMLESCTDLTLAQLNDATCAWMEMDYNRAQHAELKDTPLNRFLNGKNVSRPSPSSEELRFAFRREVVRRQRRTDGSVSIDGKRFELPVRYRHMTELTIRYAQWDLRLVHLVDPMTGALLCPLYPQDKAANAAGIRRAVTAQSAPPPPSKQEIAPLLQKLMAEYAATGLPPAYLPQNDEEETS